MSPVEVLVSGGTRPALARARQALARDPRVSRTTLTPLPGRRALLTVVPHSGPYDAASRALVRELRRGRLRGLRYLVGGETATAIDYRATVFLDLGSVAIALTPVIFLMFLAALRSLFLPLKAIVLAALTLAASLGGLILLQPMKINPFVPVVVLALVVALTTDYEVLLIGQMREAYLSTRDNTQAVITGLTQTGPVITSAAAIMFVVFATFGTARVLPVRQLGIALAISVLLDATLIRAVLVPSVMQLMGRWNWWVPRVARRAQEIGI